METNINRFNKKELVTKFGQIQPSGTGHRIERNIKITASNNEGIFSRHCKYEGRHDGQIGGRLKRFRIIQVKLNKMELTDVTQSL